MCTIEPMSLSIFSPTDAYRTIQEQTGQELFDGRCPDSVPHDNIAPPIQLFNPAFAYFTSKAFDPEYVVPHEFLCSVQRVVRSFAIIHEDDAKRRGRIQPIIGNIIDRSIYHVQNPDKTTSYGVVQGPWIGIEKTYLVVIEEKNELGDGGSDPSNQGSFSFQRISCQDTVGHGPTAHPYFSALIFVDRISSSKDLLPCFHHCLRRPLAYNFGRYIHSKVDRTATDRLPLGSTPLYP